MKKLLAILSLITIFGSCKKDIGNSQENGNLQSAAYRADSIAGSTFFVSQIKNQEARITPLAQTEYNLLGYGFDVTGEYADSSSARNQVVDIQKVGSLHPGRLALFKTTTGGSPNNITAANVEAFSEQLSNRLLATKGLKLFKGTITSAFPDTSSFSSKYIYAMSMYLIQWGIAKFNFSPYEPITPILNPAFTSDVQNISVSELVRKYGTHILSNIKLGARFEVLYQAETKREDKTDAALAGITLGSSKIFGLSTGYYFSQFSNTSGNSSQKLYYKALGGDVTKLPQVTAANSKNPTIDISNWIHSSTLGNATLIDIDPDGLIPIYEMIEDPIKKAAVKSYIEQYLSDNGIQLKN